jgi:hypothetical protein
MRATYTTCFFLGLVLAACGPSSHRGDDGDDTADDSGDDGDDSGDDGPSTDAPPPPPFPDAASCGNQTVPIEVQNLGEPPDLLVVLDRSGSMNELLPIFPPDFITKWTHMRNALNALASQHEDNIRLGLLEFPTNDDCAVDGSAVKVPIDLNQAAEIATYFATRGANGNTPSQLALAGALTYYNTIPVNPEGRFVLFATDGQPNCSTGDAAAETVAAVTALANAGVKTYVLGFGGAFIDDSVLNNSALAGQVPKPGGPPHYYAANNAAELDAALQTIAGGIIIPSCSYALASPPPDPNLVTVTLNGMTVPRSTAHTNGWDYYPDANTITFFGSYCTQIQSGAISEVGFAYGCPGPIVD